MYKYRLEWINIFDIDTFNRDFDYEAKDFDNYHEAIEYYKKLKRQNTSNDYPNAAFSLIKYRKMSLGPKIVFNED